MCDWRNADNREGAHSVVAVRLGRGKGSFCIPCLFLLKWGEIGFKQEMPYSLQIV
jgi:hypothetical protein